MTSSAASRAQLPRDSDRPIDVTPEPRRTEDPLPPPPRDDRKPAKLGRAAMFGVDTSELVLVAVLALIFIGPKDLPKVMRTVGHWVGRVRGMARHFTSGIEKMIREAELEEMEKKWREENERIMRDYPALDRRSIPSRTARRHAADLPTASRATTSCRPRSGELP